jgi:superfamily II RNA helicase
VRASHEARDEAMSPITPTERFGELYRELMLARIRVRLQHDSGYKFTDEDLSYLFSSASYLAASPGDIGEEEASARKRKAYDVVTAILELFPHMRDTIAPIVELVLARIGNFPAIDMLKSSGDNESTLSPHLFFETAARRCENTIRLGDDAPLTLTDFQSRLLDSLSRAHSLSVSAPTSAGKSFSLSVDIVRRMRVQGFTCVVYLVPTRALIRQVMYETIKQLNVVGLTDVPVLCVPDGGAADVAKKGIVYVLTQERLSALLFSPDMKKAVDVLIVDEAQEIGENRGMILESVIGLALSRNPSAAVFFSSPLTDNPAYLLSLFDRDNEGEPLAAPSAMRHEPCSNSGFYHAHR